MKSYNDPAEQLAEEADAWLVLLRSDRVTRQDKARFSRWLNISPAHRDAFDEALADWETLGALAPALPLEPEQTTARTRHPWLKAGIGGAACATVVMLLLLTWGNVSPSQQEIFEYSTAPGEWRSVTLADGSQVELNTRSAIRATFSDSERSVVLLSGEAFFEVAKDRERPFRVDFGRGLATAVGTAFNIRRADNQSVVTVTEGIVDVNEAPDFAVPDPEPVRVLANQQIQLTRSGLAAVRTASSLSTTWRERTVVFHNTPLDKAVKELNRYLISPVTLAPGVEDLRVSGTFSLDRPSETLNAVTAAFQLSIDKATTDGSLYLKHE